MNTQEVMKKKRRGDVLLASQMLGINYGNARVIIQRPGTRRYTEMMAALVRIIAAREELISEGRESVNGER